MSKFTLLSEKDLVRLYEKARKDLEIDPLDIYKSVIDQLGKQTEWLELYRREKAKLKKLKQVAEKRWAELFFSYRLDKKRVSEEGVLLVQPKEIENAIKRDPDWLLTKSKLEHQELVVEFIKSILDMFGDRKWLMKDLVELMKLDKDAI